MKKIFGFIIVVLMTLVNMNFIGANTNGVTLELSGNDNVNKEENITLTLSINNVDDEVIAGLGSKIVYDKEYLELVSISKANSPFDIMSNMENAKFAGIAFSQNDYITSDIALVNIEFKALKTGSTTISLEEIEVCDNSAELIDTFVISKTININEVIETEIIEVEKTDNNYKDLVIRIKTLMKNMLLDLIK